MRQTGLSRARSWPALAVILAAALGMLLAGCAQVGGPRGTLVGDVVAGPTCPVESIEHPCPPKPVPHRQVTIETPGGTVVTTTTTDVNGHFSVTLPPGNYVIRVLVGPGLLGIRQLTPGNVTVVAGQTVSVKITLDTGIR